MVVGGTIFSINTEKNEVSSLAFTRRVRILHAASAQRARYARAASALRARNVHAASPAVPAAKEFVRVVSRGAPFPAGPWGGIAR